MIRAKRPNLSTRRSTGLIWPNAAKRKSQKARPRSTFRPTSRRKLKADFRAWQLRSRCTMRTPEKDTGCSPAHNGPIPPEIALGLSGKAFRPRTRWRIKKRTGRGLWSVHQFPAVPVCIFASTGARLGASSPFVALTRSEALPVRI